MPGQTQTGTVTEAIAFHEAAHSVIAAALGVSLKTKGLRAPGDKTGRVRHHSPLRGMQLEIDDSDRGRRSAEDAIKVCLAGPIAYRRRRPHSSREEYGISDYAAAFELAERACGSREVAVGVLESLLLDTVALVDRLWGPISTAAATLLRKGSMTGAEIASLLNPPHRAGPEPARGEPRT